MSVLVTGAAGFIGFHVAQALLGRGEQVVGIERLLGRTARRELLPMQPGDVAASWADIEASRRHLGFEPKTTIETGLARFVEWYRDYHATG